ncbi:Cyclic pyranopterin monophosphate synthase [compost metagenome]
MTCLFAESGFDLKSPMRQGATDEELSAMIRSIWSGRGDRYSDLRWDALQSGKPYSTTRKIEMITLGG